MIEHIQPAGLFPSVRLNVFDYLREDPRVRVRFGGKVYPCTAVLAGKPGELEGFPEDRFVINTSKYNITSSDVRFIFFPFFNCHVMLFKIIIIRKTLNTLSHKIAVRHWMSDDSNFLSHLLKNCGYSSGGLTLT